MEPLESDRAVEREAGRRTRRSLLIGAGAAVAGFAGWEWIRTRRVDAGIPWPLRRTLDTNEAVARDFFKPGQMAPQFPVSEAVKNLRVNERIGMEDPVVEDDWKLSVVGADTNEEAIDLTMEDVRKLPHVEHVTLLKCVEGWSEKVHWGGARFADFAKAYPPPEDVQYVGMETPDGEFYVGLDLASALQPQTLLCYELNGEPLPDAHGAPLRLVIPTKYGIKNIKRVGKIFYSQSRPRDYWAERGYDWYAGL